MSDLIDAHVAHLCAAGYSPRTVYTRTRILRRIDGDLPQGINAPSRAELTTWFAPWTGWTLYTYFEALNTYYTWATSGRSPYLEWNPLDDLARPRVPQHEPRPVPDQDIATALALLDDPWRTAVLIAAAQGLRCEEICKLDREHVTPEHTWVDRKGGKRQLLPTHSAVWELVSPLPPGAVVRTSVATRYGPSHLSGGVSRALTDIGLPTATLHRFRASFATRLAREGVHVSVIQSLMGHSSVETTLRYIQVEDEQRRLAICTLPIPTRHQLVTA